MQSILRFARHGQQQNVQCALYHWRRGCQVARRSSLFGGGGRSAVGGWRSTLDARSMTVVGWWSEWPSARQRWSSSQARISWECQVLTGPSYSDGGVQVKCVSKSVYAAEPSALLWDQELFGRPLRALLVPLPPQTDSFGRKHIPACSPAPRLTSALGPFPNTNQCSHPTPPLRHPPTLTRTLGYSVAAVAAAAAAAAAMLDGRRCS